MAFYLKETNKSRQPASVEVRKYSNKRELIAECLSGFSSSGMGYRPGRDESLANVIAGMNWKQKHYDYELVSATEAKKADAVWAHRGNVVWE